MQRLTITQHFLKSRARAWNALRFKRARDWLTLEWAEYVRRAEAAARALQSLGLERGDRVAILSATRVEWPIADFAVMGLGAVTVPIYPSYRREELEFLLKDSRPRVLIVENLAQFEKFAGCARRDLRVETVVVFDASPELPAGTLTWDELLARGVGPEPDDSFARAIADTRLGDVATIVYTSGTTGEPKGVVLTHLQIASEVEDITRAFLISPRDSTLSFLPYAHVLGRMESWLHVYVGFTMSFAESLEALRANLGETRPTVMIGVPRVFEKIYAGLLTEIEKHPRRRQLLTALESVERWPVNRLIDLLFYRRLWDALGGRLRFVVSGGAPLEPKIASLFAKAGILICEGYGLTETTAAITSNTPEAFESGTVGRPFRDVELKIAADGEILVRSEKVFARYLHDDAATARAFEDGYFRTGDVGQLTPAGFLRITDRKKDLIKTSGGKYVAPQKLEGLLKLDPLVSNVLIHGDQQKYVVALITLNEGYLKRVAVERGWSYPDVRTLTQMNDVREMVRRAVANANAGLASFETIKNFAVLPDDFTVENGELTPSLKVKRRVLDEKYREQIRALYD